MLRRSFLELSSRQFFRRKPTWSTTQIPSFLSSRKQYSVAPQKNASQGPGSTGKPSEPGSPLPKFIVGGLVLGVAFVGYHFGGQYIQEQRSAVVSAKLGTNDPPELSKRVKDLQEDKHLGDQNVMSSTRVSNVSIPTTEPAEENIETHSDLLNGNEGEIRFQEKDVIQSKPEEEVTPVRETEFPSSTQSSMTSDDESKTSTTSLEERLYIKSTEVKPSTQLHEAVESKPVLNQGNSNAEEKSVAPQLQTATDVPEDAVSVGVEQQPNSILDEYYLRNKVEAPTSTSSDEQKDVVGAIEDSSDVFISKDGKLVLDFLQAIHAAEKRQAELDAHIFCEEKRKMKEKYEKELKDARVRELMYAEEAAILDKELNRERLKAAAALKSLQEELEEKIKMELEQMEAEAELKLKKIQELAKAELAAAIASEKASQIEKMAEANLHINALCMAFYARSEQARQSHSVHKLALGTLALEDALSKGLPFRKEIDALHTYLEGVDKDPLLDLVLSSLPEETQSSGTDTVLQLKRKFDALKGTLRPFSLIPPGGGGILAHSVAQVASWLKVREADQSGDGIESLINKVESFLAEGKLSEAADTLENGVKGTKAAEVIGEWLQLARNRAITEQALTLLQSYATSISVS